MKEVKPINILKAKNREELRLWLENNYETQKRMLSDSKTR